MSTNKPSKRHGPEFYRALLQSRSPKQPLADLARQHDLCPATLYRWRDRLRLLPEQRNTSHDSSPSLLPVRVLQPPSFQSASQDCPFELLLESGLTLRIPSSFDSRILTKLLELLRP